jgi:mycothiol S-conjugate amidase
MTPKRLLLALAHPDDEAFGSGGLIAKYVQAGVEVYYILGTDGAKGTVAPDYLERYGSIKAVRQAEMDCAAQTLGFKQVFPLGYGDSGMMGSRDNADPGCLWQANETEVTGKIVAILRQIQPQVVLTFDPYGAYGHPDHIFMHRATTRAFHAANDPTQFEGSPYQPQKLYYTTFPRAMLRLFILTMRLKGQDPRRAGMNHDLDLMAILDQGLPITTKIDVSAHFDDWERAADCHASQGSFRRGIPLWQRRLLASKQGLTRVYPEWQAGHPLERDLFDGVIP